MSWEKTRGETMAKLPHTRAAMRGLDAVWQIAAYAAGERYTTATRSRTFYLRINWLRVL